MNNIKWYKDCLINAKAYEKRLRDALNIEVDKLNRVAYENDFSEFQIMCAEKEGKEYYSDKYKRKLFEAKFVNKYKKYLYFFIVWVLFIVLITHLGK